MSYIQPKTDFKDGDILYGIDLNASNEVIKAGVDDNFDRIQGLEAEKQDTLTAGTGIEITEDNVINNTQTSAEWGNIQGDITDQTDLVDALGAKQDVIDSSHKLDYGLLSNTPTIPSKTSDLTNDNNTVIDASYVHTDNNYSDTDKGKLAGIESGAEANIIETIKVDGTSLTPDANKAINIDLSGKIDEPTTEGTNGQVLTTDGNGGRTWTTVQGGGGTGDYTDLTNKPQINNVTLSGNKSLSDLGINIPTKTSDLNNDSGYVTNTDYATSSTGGVIRVGGNSVSINNDGKLMADVRTYSNYQSAGNSIFIGKGTLENVITGKELVSSSSLATVATSGSYSDLSNTPTIPTKLSDLTNDNDTVTDASYVHTDNNYTSSEKSKLGNIEAGAKDNVVNLYAVSATAPSGGTLLSIYYNTTDHKFYQKQMNLGLEWVELPNMTPKYGVIYVTSESKATYVYDGITLVCIGSNDLVMVNEDATENTKLVIEEDDFAPNMVAIESLPIGAIIEYPTVDSSKLPTGYMFCDGSAISRTTYAELFALIGTSFGSGDGSTTFNLPTKEGLVTAGINSSDTDFDTIGKTLGEKTHQLTVNELAAHSHLVRNNMGGIDSSANTGTGSWGQKLSYTASGATAISSNGYVAQNTGSNIPHNNIQPTQVSNFIIKVSETSTLIGQVVNSQSDSQTDAYSCDYANKVFGGKVLWTNPNPTSDFANQNITLSSDDYDVLKIFYKATKSGIEVFSQETLKECSGSLSQVWGGGNNTNSRVRSFTYSNVTTYNISAGYQVSGGSGSQKNDIIIPLYVIGYKTGLFS